MSYVKNIWANGDVITAEKLNNMETGIDSVVPDIIIEPTSNIQNVRLSSSNTNMLGDFAGCVTKLLNEEPIHARFSGVHVVDGGSAGISINSYNTWLSSIYYNSNVQEITLRGRMFALSCDLDVYILIGANGVIDGSISPL